MGALENSGDGRTFLNTFKGHFTKRANSETEGAVERKNKNGAMVWELKFDTLKDVIIQEFERRHSDEYGFSWNIKLAHVKSDETFTLTLPYSGRITMGLFFRLPNTDINKELTMKLYYFEEEDKTALVVYQNGNKVEAYWTKDTPHDMPELVQREKAGKTEWDSEDRMKYLENYLEKDIRPKMNMLTVDNHGGTGSVEIVEPEAQQSPAEVEYVEETKTWKKKHTDGKHYECTEKGVFHRDQDGKMTDALPF